jgi:hypothetical protein
MQATKVMANLRVADIEAAKSFYADYLGLTNEEFNMGWVARYTSADRRAVVQLVRLRRSPETRLRDRASIEYRGVGLAPVLRACPGRQCDQHGQPPRLKLRRAYSLNNEIASRASQSYV